MEFANVGSADRMARIIVGAILFILPLMGIIATSASTLGIVMMIVGVVLVVTGVFSFCPLYRIIGTSTRS
ncbi:MAG: DUF2892 domain-containing protein [Pseudomonadota bacterium]